jgi:hypothetical protein
MSQTVILTGMPEEKKVAQKIFPGVLVLTGTDKLNLANPGLGLE